MNISNFNSLPVIQDTNKTQLWENLLYPLRGLPLSYADSREEYRILIPTLCRLNRGIIVLCGFGVFEEHEYENIILIEIEKSSKNELWELLHFLQPISILLKNQDKNITSTWKLAIEEYGSPIIYVDFSMGIFEIDKQCKAINQLLWNATYKEKKSLFGLNIGCGTQPLPNWINVDVNFKYPDVGFLNAELPFPYPDASFQNVLSEHMFEHLTFKSGIQMLKEVYRILATNGLLVLSVPTLDFLIKLYSNPNSQLHKQYIRWSTSTFDPFVAEFYSGEEIPPMFTMNNFMRFWGHKMIYDEISLSKLLHRIGFSDVKCMKIGEFRFEQTTIERHGHVIPDWANQIEAKTFIARK